MAVSSTGINNLETVCKDKLLINEEYFETFWDNDLYYFVCFVLKYMKKCKIRMYGVNQRHMEGMLKFGGFEQKQKVEFDYLCKDDKVENVVFVLGKNTSLAVLQNLENLQGKNVTIIMLDIQGYQEELSILKKYMFSMKKLG